MRGQHWGGVSKCNEEDAVAPLCRVGSLHKAYLTPEGLKVGRRHGNMVGSASHSEMHNAILFCGRPLNHCSGIGRWSGETRENGQYPTTEEDRRCLQASVQTALESWKQE